MLSITQFSAVELSEFSNLPEDVREEVKWWHDELSAVTRPYNRSIKALARKAGKSFNTAWAKYHKWKRAGCDWRVLVNRNKAREYNAGVSREFVEWYLTLAEKHQRNTHAAHRSFGRMWKNGQHIPGLDNALPRTCLPEGCTYANLQKHLAAHKLSLLALRRGLGVARQHGPMTFTTRAGLWVGSHYFIDDVEHDNFVIWRGQLVRVLEIGVQDCYSASRFAWGCKPRFEDAQGKFDNLKERAARLIAAKAMWEMGYSPRGTVWMTEHGTAALGEVMAKIMHDSTAGLVKVRTSGITGREQAVLGMGEGRGGGNPRFKGPLESLHNLIHNELQALPGQTGLSVDRRPEWLHGQLKGDSQLLKAAAMLAKVRPDRVGLLKFRLLQYHAQFLPLLEAVYESIDRRGEDPELFAHELEGWHAAGLVHAEFRLSPDSAEWQSSERINLLAAPMQVMFLELAKAQPGYTRERKLSPREVMSAGRGGLKRMPGVVIAEMLGDDYAREEKVDAGCFTFQDDELAPELLRYESRITTPAGTVAELPVDKYRLAINPFALDHIFVSDGAGRHLGVARREMRAGRADAEALGEAIGHAEKRFNELLKPTRERWSGYTSDEVDRTNGNADVLAGVAVSREEKAREREVRSNVRRYGAEAAEDILSASEEPAEEPTHGAASELLDAL